MDKEQLKFILNYIQLIGMMNAIQYVGFFRENKRI